MANGRVGSILLWKTNLKRVLRNIRIPFTNIKLAPKFGPESKIEKMGSYESIAQLFNGNFFENIGRLNREMVKTELDWDGLGGAGGGMSAQGIRDEVINLYSEFNHEEHKIQSSIGPFVNRSALSREYTYADKGSGFNPDNNYTFDEKAFVIDLSKSGGRPISVKFNIPPDREIVHNGYSYKVAYFGPREGGYWPQLDRDITKICDDVKQRLLSANLNEMEKRQITENIDSISGKFVNIKKYLEKIMNDFENEIRGALGGAGSGLQGKHKDLEDLRTQIMKKALTDEMVYYTHTYKVINVNNKGELLNLDGTIAKGQNGNPLALPESFQQGREIAPGLDEHGWPLEVGDGRTLFEGRIIPFGTLVLDFYDGHSPNGGAPRSVDPRFTKDCDVLDVALWVYISFDSKRDDLRDGRYHKNAITAMDRIMTELGIKWHSQTMERIEAGKQAEIRMRLNKLAGNPLRFSPPNEDSDDIELTMRPTHINPAFDMRATTKDKHMGRRYYYDLQENVSRSLKPTITTRGAALYILHRVIEETKYWGGTNDPRRAGVIEVLEEIGKRISGYDIGPNMGYEEGGEKLKGWGRSLPINPFRPRGR